MNPEVLPLRRVYPKITPAPHRDPVETERRFASVLAANQEYTHIKATTRPLLLKSNFTFLEKTGYLAVKELIEVIEAVGGIGIKAGAIGETVVEVLDVLTFPTDIVQGLHLPVNVREVLAGVNGVGKRSDALDKVQEVAINLNSRDNEKKLAADMVIFYSYLFSFLKHLPPFEEGVNLKIKNKNEINKANYPEELLTLFNQNGKLLEQDEMKAKEAHVIKSLKHLREQYPETGRLLPKNWKLVKPYIDGFLDSSKNLELLKIEYAKLGR